MSFWFDRVLLAFDMATPYSKDEAARLEPTHGAHFS
jgi:hypothetical protein